MARKDSEKDSERPHYYSQFWLDVAAGRRVIGAPRPGEEAEQAEAEAPEPISSRRTGRSGTSDHEFAEVTPASSNGQAENIQHPVAEPIEEPEAYAEVEPEEEIPEEELDYGDTEEVVEDEDIPDMDLDVAEEDEDEELYEDEEEDDDLGWGGRGRKKPKPGRAAKPQRSKPRRDRRGF